MRNIIVMQDINHRMVGSHAKPFPILWRNRTWASMRRHDSIGWIHKICILSRGVVNGQIIQLVWLQHSTSVWRLHMPFVDQILQMIFLRKHVLEYHGYQENALILNFVNCLAGPEPNTCQRSHPTNSAASRQSDIRRPSNQGTKIFPSVSCAKGSTGRSLRLTAKKSK